ncbi:nucleotide exchange factor GrpE [Candidatus Amesbacteria bacterium RIFCSPHIGHO2_01_FULL_48_32]|uniref:Protein GrpE n=1 Tax=Candidatus Amesbacteria bacterium RIFCSPLOWO2_01_FULL_48_25 TaxID=1797259 RepID=A0A1F4ZAP6_9BACT|nr:MAG: nucleotide exchange factor GrpE [Candidatus Amesbacteria bacterium RIFCSPHIGHO2_01_FULL_48_32]OGD03333.1 MAG: nucleotide exchange factor GrpE [Candidatus Amesbacteria bacterium RIFCSPLOWO2_01_FULL_48_25]HJZ05285.1 nucleotide exchange factor GrpE [Patescibacteria group bacterium]
MKTKKTDEIKTLNENWKRALADYQNLSKRVEADKKEFVKFAAANIVTKLIPTLDVLELAAAHSSDPGIQMAVKQFQDVLSSESLQSIITAPGEPFDHTIHECIETILGEPDNSVVELVAKGYKIDGLVIRPAKVKVYKKI